MKYDTLEAIVNLIPLASKDKYRYSISGVYISQAEGQDRVKLVVTNGHLLIEQFVEDSIPLGEYFATREELLGLKHVLKEHKSTASFDCSVDSEKGLILGTKTLARIPKMSGSFADYERVIPKPLHQTSICINAEYLYQISEAIRAHSNTNNVRIVFDPFKPMNPILIQQGNRTDFVAALMPCRDDQSNVNAEKLSEIAFHIPDDAIVSLPGQDVPPPSQL